jgi:hypothetical protein
MAGWDFDLDVDFDFDSDLSGAEVADSNSELRRGRWGAHGECSELRLSV